MISSASSGGAGYSASGEVRLAARAAVIIALGSWPLPRAFPLAHDCPRPWPLLPLSVQNAGPVRCFNTPLNRRRTSAAAVGLRASLPLKMTSSMRSPRRLLALCSPITHVMASATLLLPHPFGPTIAVTPLSKASSERSENDLKPLISIRSRRMDYTTAERGGLASCEGRSRHHALDTKFSPGWEADRQRTTSAAVRPPIAEGGPGPRNGRECTK